MLWARLSGILLTHWRLADYSYRTTASPSTSEVLHSACRSESWSRASLAKRASEPTRRAVFPAGLARLKHDVPPDSRSAPIVGRGMAVICATGRSVL